MENFIEEKILFCWKKMSESYAFIVETFIEENYCFVEGKYWRIMHLLWPPVHPNWPQANPKMTEWHETFNYQRYYAILKGLPKYEN